MDNMMNHEMNPMVSPAMTNMMNPMFSPAMTNMMNPMFSPAMTNMMNPMVSPEMTNMKSPMMKGMAGSEEELMREIQKVGFAAVDLHLYLDTHPTDRYALMLYGHFSRHLKMLMDMYSRQYGAIEPGADTHSCPFSWVMSPWPWMKKDYMYDEEEY